MRKVKLAKNQGLVDQSLTALAEKHGKHVADMMLDLALEEGLDTEFQLMTRSDAEEAQIADMVKSGHALPTQSDAGAHLNTNFCTAGESSYVLGQWVRDRELLSLEDAIRRYTFQPARILGLHAPRRAARRRRRPGRARARQAHGRPAGSRAPRRAALALPRQLGLTGRGQGLSDAAAAARP